MCTQAWGIRSTSPERDENQSNSRLERPKAHPSGSSESLRASMGMVFPIEPFKDVSEGSLTPASRPATLAPVPSMVTGSGSGG